MRALLRRRFLARAARSALDGGPSVALCNHAIFDELTLAPVGVLPSPGIGHTGRLVVAAGPQLVAGSQLAADLLRGLGTAINEVLRPQLLWAVRMLPPAVGLRAAERSLRRLGARRLSTRTVPVLFSAQTATGLLGHFVAAIRGGNLYRKASFLLDALGKKVFAEHVRIHEQPHLPAAIGSAPFDAEGVATENRDLVSDGILQGYVLSSYSARKLGMQTTANAGGVHNLSADASPGDADLDTLLATMDSGLYVTELMGMGINTVTGDYSRGAAGFWVEGGAIQHPVEEITIAGNLRDMYRGIQAIGADQDRRGNIRTGSVLIDAMTVAGT